MLNKKRIKFKTHFNSSSFLILLYDILNENIYQKIIHWDSEGTILIISNINKLCEIILPKYFKHNKYSSFIRQLNKNGFHKIKVKSINEERFVNNKINIKTTKKEIIEIINENRKNNTLNKYNNNNINSNKINPIFTLDSQNFILKYLFEKNEKNSKDILELKKEVLELNKENLLIDNIMETFNNNLNGHNIILSKIINHKNKGTNINKKNKYKKSKNLNELFKKYLYHLTILSPYVSIKNNNTISKNQKISNKFNNIDIDINNEFTSEELLSQNYDIRSFDFNSFNMNIFNSLFNSETDLK